jgi:hypothetical protein
VQAVRATRKRFENCMMAFVCGEFFFVFLDDVNLEVVVT